MAKSSKPLRNLSESYVNQLNVLKSLAPEGAILARPRPYQINEIAELTGLRDEREIQRYLFILEGQKLVAPFPEGDFTSKTWHITKNGMKAVKTLQRSITQ